VLNPDGTYQLDAEGRRMVYRRTTSEEGEEYGELPTRIGEYEVPYTSGAEMRDPTATIGGSGPGIHRWKPSIIPRSDWGSGADWQAIPRHRHPTRLSDVPEEDERSRTSPSRAKSSQQTMH